MPPSDSSAPEFREWQIAAVRLLQGVIYADDERLWSIVLNWRSQLEAYLARIGLLLVVDEPEGYAFVRQWTEDENLRIEQEQIPQSEVVTRLRHLGPDAEEKAPTAVEA